MQVLADVAAQERSELVDGEACERPLAGLLEVAGERTAERAFDQRPSQRPQMVAAGADLIDRAVEMGIRGERVRAVEPQIELVGEAERQHLRSRDLGGKRRREA